MIKSISSLLFYANDIVRTFEFYKSLGFTVKKENGMVNVRVNRFEMNFIDKETATIKEEADLEPKGLGMFIYVKVDDVDAFYKQAIKNGIKPSSGPKDWEWGNREFVIKDPNGYKLVFFKNLPPV